MLKRKIHRQLFLLPTLLLVAATAGAVIWNESDLPVSRTASLGGKMVKARICNHEVIPVVDLPLVTVYAERPLCAGADACPEVPVYRVNGPLVEIRPDHRERFCRATFADGTFLARVDLPVVQVTASRPGKFTRPAEERERPASPSWRLPVDASVVIGYLHRLFRLN